MMTLSEYLQSFDGPLARLVRRWCRQWFPAAPPDPWPEQVDEDARSPDAVPLCIDCLRPQTGLGWFCPHCGHATGEFVTLMPYLQIFAAGEVFRKGVIGPPEKRKGVLVFLFLYSFGEYSVFAPLYWFWMIRRAMGQPICEERRKDLTLEEQT
jgi:hypothetical protein